MAIKSDYISGTLTITQGSTAFTGTGTGWRSAEFKEGDTLIDITGATEYMGVIEEITGEASGTLTKPWEGPSLVNVPYRMRYQPDGSRSTAQARNLIEILGNGNITAFSALNGSANTLPMFTGAGAMTLVPSSSFTPGAGSITNAQLANVPTATIKGRIAAGAGVPTDLTVAQVWSLLGVAPVANIPATLTPDKAYRRGNILGTVSQAGGVPTGAIIEQGSNANGEYVRFADGTQICWMESATLATTTVTSGSGFQGSALTVVTYPSAFIAPPKIALAGKYIAGARGWPTVADDSRVTTTNVQLIAHSFVSSSQITAHVTATGRWF